MNYLSNPGNALAQLMLMGWTPICILLFAVFPPRRAVIYSYMFGWLFLPMNMIAFGGLPDINKATATNFGCLAGTLLFHPDVIGKYRLQWFDIPILLYITCPIPSSLTNGDGLWDGVSISLDYASLWGLPYFLGRVYFNDIGAMKELLVAILLGGLVYVPLCVWEVVMSPQLHKTFYGFHQHQFAQTVRGDSYRPMVFMQHGLMVGAWMGACTLMGYWLWRSNAVKRIYGFPIWYALIPLAITFVLTKSFGAIFLVFMGVAVLYACRKFQSGLPIIAMCLVMPLYVGVRTAGVWDGQDVVAAVEKYVNADRAQSVGFRFENEEYLLEHAKLKWWWGHGGWGRALPYRPNSDQKVTPDGLWIIILAQNGVWGLTWMIIGLTLPSLMFAIYCPRQVWAHPAIGPSTIVAVVLMIYAIDMLPNAMMNPLYALAGGGLVALTWEQLRFVAIRPGAPVEVRQVQVGRQMPLTQ